MTDKLKEFINKNKKAFDTEEPSNDLWDKIDSGMEASNSSWISSKLLSNLKYLALSASVLLVVVYFITQKLSESSSNEISQNINDSARNNSGEWVRTRQQKNNTNVLEKNVTVGSNQENHKENPSSLTNELPNKLAENSKAVNSEDSVDQSVISETHHDNPVSMEVNEPVLNSASEKKANTALPKLKMGKVNVPSEPEKVNTYGGTLFTGYSLCSVLRAYKFPGQVSMDEGGNYTSHRSLKTISCNRLEKTSNVKAVWIKGKTSKKMTIAIKEGFKNIVLIKSNGQLQNPVAISHYYQGLGVISDYSGKKFDMIFKDKVELILFFKDIEDGDKISIDGIMEVPVKSTL